MPDLWLTVSRYLASLRAVLAPDEDSKGDRPIGWALDEAEHKQNRLQFERTDRLVKQFMLNEGPQLQRDLKEYANKCQNWVSIKCLRMIELALVATSFAATRAHRLVKS